MEEGEGQEVVKSREERKKKIIGRDNQRADEKV